MCEEVNAAFRAHDHVIIYFLVRALKGMYGVARMGCVRTYVRTDMFVSYFAPKLTMSVTVFSSQI